MTWVAEVGNPHMSKPLQLSRPPSPLPHKVRLECTILYISLKAWCLNASLRRSNLVSRTHMSRQPAVQSHG